VKFKKLILDFDLTLFDADRFLRDVFLIFNKYGVSEEDFYNSYEATKKVGPWNPFRHAGLAFKKSPAGLKEDINGLFKKSGDYLFDDVIPFLNHIKTENILLSYGDEETQLSKIKCSGIAKYFKSIVITSDQLKTDFFDKYENESSVIFVEDRANTINAVKSKFPSIFCVLIKRPESKLHDEEVSEVLADMIIKTPSDLKTIL